MAFRKIEYKNKILSIHKSIIDPDFGGKTVLVTDTWDYVEMWLKREQKNDALFFWQQARNFFHAYEQLPKTSSPLLAYYCFLNAAKALLLVKGKAFSQKHGVTGETSDGRISLSNEIVQFKGSGVLAELCRYFNETANNEKYTLKGLLYNLPYIHRAYSLSFSSQPELFIPIKNPKFVKSKANNESWFCAELDERYSNMKTIAKLPSQFERDNSFKDKFIIRMKKRFRWVHGKENENIIGLKKYHAKTRVHLFYIYGPYRLWYLKRGGAPQDRIDRSSLTLTFAAMHKLSELARYAPDKLSKHFDSRHNWLLTDFIQTAVLQFVDEISSEITGSEFMVPGRATRGRVTA